MCRSRSMTFVLHAMNLMHLEFTQISRDEFLSHVEDESSRSMLFFQSFSFWLALAVLAVVGVAAFEDEDAGDLIRPYNFAYAVNDVRNYNVYSRSESSDGTSVQGQYQTLMPDGRTQIVK